MKDRKRIRRDSSGESIAYPFILIISLVLLLGFMLAGVGQYAVSGEITQGGYPGMTMPFGLMNYTTIDCDIADDRYITFTEDGNTIEGYRVSDDDVLDHVPYPTDDDPFTYWHEDEPDQIKYVHIIRNNRDYDPESTDLWEKYQDFVSIRRHTGAFDWDTQWNNAAVPFTQIEDNFWLQTNVSITEFQLSGSQDSIFVNATYPGLQNFTADLWDNDFNMFYGWSLFRMDEVDFWGAVAMVLYADIPGVHPIVDWIVHGFVIATLVFVVFTMGIRMTPFLGGG